jgi:hypothetical protein
MAGRMEAVMTGKWSLGYDAGRQLTILIFEFSDRQPIVVAISPDNAEQIAKAMLEQLRNPPPRLNRLS